MKNVFLYAYDRQNLGDDLFVHTITKRYPDVRFFIWTSKENQAIFSCLPNLKVIDGESRWVRFLRKLRASFVPRYREWLENRCDAVVYIGGSIFMEYDNWEQILTWWEYEAKNRPFYVLGANFGPYKTQAYREKMAAIFGEMRDVCFRDRYSYKLFDQTNTVRYAPDILLSYEMPCVQIKEKNVFVSVIDCAAKDDAHGLKRHDTRYVQNMAAILQGYLSEGYTVTLASFCKEEGDENGIAKIISAIKSENDPRIKTVFYNGKNTQEVTTAIAQAEYVIATRFHATILAMAAGRPVLPIIYSDKTRHVLEDMGFDGVSFDLRDENVWDYRDSRRNLDEPERLICNDIKNEAEKHFSMLDAVLC